jgi:PLP dependent protein
MGSILLALNEVRERIRQCALKSGRRPEEVKLVAVSKSKPAERVREAYEAGQRDFGENYVQELTAKAEALADLTELRWHMIGHLQTNKAKLVVQVVHMVQSVDSVRLVAELARRAESAGKPVAVLLEINVGGEQQKTGASASEARDLLEAVVAQRALWLRGLMTVPPFELQASETSRYFEKLRQLRDDLGGPDVLPELSMGMSHDFGEAIAQGATMVRVGTLIFGAR